MYHVIQRVSAAARKVFQMVRLGRELCAKRGSPFDNHDLVLRREM